MGGVLKAVGSFFGGGQQQTAQQVAAAPIPVAPKVEDKEVTDATEAERQRQKRAAGRASTDLTGGLGDTSDAPSARKQLLG
jgi:hypothetical protein